MAGNIKGITIEIDGNTAPLQKALESVNKKSASITKELGAINRALKLDPTNTTLLAQKQKVLGEAVENTGEKLKKLKDAQAQVQAQFEKGDITAEQYREFEREIVKTETALGKYEEGLKETNAAIAENGEEAQRAAQESKQYAEAQQAAAEKTKAAAEAAERFNEKLDKVATIGLTACVGALTAIGAAVVKAGKQLWQTANEAGDYADALLTSSQQTGLAAKQLQELQYATRFVDVEIDTLTGSMAKNIKNMQSAANGSKSTAAAYKELGVEYQNADGTLRDGKTVYWEVIEALGAMKNETQRDAIAMQILGKSAQDVNPLIKIGAGELQKLAAEADALGIIMDDKTVAALGRFDDVMEKVDAQAIGFKNNLVASVAGPLEKVGQAASNAFQKLNKSLKSGALKTSMQSLGKSLEKLTVKLAEAAAKGIPKLVKAFGWIVDNGEKVFSVTASVTAGFAALKAALEIQKVVKAATAAWTTFKAAQVATAAATGAATTAQLGFNAALKANPIGIVATAIAVLIAGMVTFAATSEKSRTETQKLNAQLDTLEANMEDSKTAHAENMTAITNEAVATSALVSRLETLMSKTSLTAGEQAELEAIVAQLNESCEGLNLTYDAQTRTLSKTIKNVKDYTRAKYAEAKAEEYTERAIDYLGQQEEAMIAQATAAEKLANAKKKLGEANQAYTEAITAGGNPYTIAAEYGNDIKTATEELAAAQAVMDKADEKVNELEQSIADNEAALEGAATAATQYMEATQNAADEAEQFAWKGYDLTEVLKQTGISADDAAEKLDNYAGVTQNAFEKIQSSVNLTAAELTANLTANQQLMGEWSANMDTLAQRTTSAGQQIDSGFMATLREMGPEAAGTVANLATASQDDFNAFVDAYSTGGAEAVQALLTELGAPALENGGAEAVQEMIDGAQEKKIELDAVMEKIITDAKETAYEAIGTAKFDEVGFRISDGIAKGIRDGIPTINSAINQAIDEAVECAREKAEINSPSKLMEDKVGYDLGRGIGAGIPKALSYIKGMVDRTIQGTVDAVNIRGVQPATAVGHSTTLNQYNYTHDSLSPSELADEARAVLQRLVRS